jgi:Domain of unknown function (DUF5069)
MDLTKRPPRSPRVRLGGYVILPRMIDKCRATLAGTAGEFHYDCPLDQHFLTFAGIDPEQFKREVQTGKGDGELLSWIEANCRNKPAPWQIAQWSTFQELRSPEGAETCLWFAETTHKAAPKRNDISRWFDLLDVDDFVSYGGKA